MAPTFIGGRPMTGAISMSAVMATVAARPAKIALPGRNVYMDLSWAGLGVIPSVFRA
jgi:hypothetical protein